MSESSLYTLHAGLVENQPLIYTSGGQEETQRTFRGRKMSKEQGGCTCRGVIQGIWYTALVGAMVGLLVAGGVTGNRTLMLCAIAPGALLATDLYCRCCVCACRKLQESHSSRQQL